MTQDITTWSPLVKLIADLLLHQLVTFFTLYYIHTPHYTYYTTLLHFRHSFSAAVPVYPTTRQPASHLHTPHLVHLLGVDAGLPLLRQLVHTLVERLQAGLGRLQRGRLQQSHLGAEGRHGRQQRALPGLS